MIRGKIGVMQSSQNILEEFRPPLNPLPSREGKKRLREPEIDEF
jgi:hypothetical protein